MIIEPFRPFLACEFRVKFATLPWERNRAAALRRQVFCEEQKIFSMMTGMPSTISRSPWSLFRRWRSPMRMSSAPFASTREPRTVVGITPCRFETVPEGRGHWHLIDPSRRLFRPRKRLPGASSPTCKARTPRSFPRSALGHARRDDLARPSPPFHAGRPCVLPALEYTRDRLPVPPENRRPEMFQHIVEMLRTSRSIAAKADIAGRGPPRSVRPRHGPGRRTVLRSPTATATCSSPSKGS